MHFLGDIRCVEKKMDSQYFGQDHIINRSNTFIILKVFFKLGAKCLQATTHSHMKIFVQFFSWFLIEQSVQNSFNGIL